MSSHRRSAIATLAFAIAVLCAGVMGFAIQRGGTCTVAAVHEIVEARSARKLLALVEAALWVGGGLLVANTLGLLPAIPADLPVSRWTVAGAALLGIGAWVNGACVFGAVARIGSGEWAYLAMPLGFFAGCASAARLFGTLPAPAAGGGSPLLAAPAWLALAFFGFVAWRLLRPAFGAARRRGQSDAPAARWHRALAARVWAPHAATTVIGLMFLATLLLAGPWAYTDVIAALARGMGSSLAPRTALFATLFAALLAGAVLGGWTAGRLARSPSRAAPTLRCFAGGLLMGCGSLLAPGGNDGLVLVGMPLLFAYAWVAFGTMCVVVAAALLVSRRVRSAASRGRGEP